MKITRGQLRKLILQEAKYLRFPHRDSPSRIDLDRLEAQGKAAMRSKDVTEVPQKKDADYGFAFLDESSGELHHPDDLYGSGGGFDGRMPYMYYVYAGLKKIGYERVDGIAVDHLMFYASSER